jgi:hypothetical protein
MKDIERNTIGDEIEYSVKGESVYPKAFLTLLSGADAHPQGSSEKRNRTPLSFEDTYKLCLLAFSRVVGRTHPMMRRGSGISTLSSLMRPGVNDCLSGFHPLVGRIYQDVRKMEMATVEVKSPQALVLLRSAIHQLLEEAINTYLRPPQYRISIHRSNVAYSEKGEKVVSWAHHLNISTETDFDIFRVAAEHNGFFIASLLNGSGGLDLHTGNFIWCAKAQDVSTVYDQSGSCHSAHPLICGFRKEDNKLKEGRRLHVVNLDIPLTEKSYLLSVGIPNIFVLLLEQNANVPQVSFPEPLAALRIYNRDITLTERLPCRVNGSRERITLFELEGLYFASFKREIARFFPNCEWMQEVLDLWERRRIESAEGLKPDPGSEFDPFLHYFITETERKRAGLSTPELIAGIRTVAFVLPFFKKSESTDFYQFIDDFLSSESEVLARIMDMAATFGTCDKSEIPKIMEKASRILCSERNLANIGGTVDKLLKKGCLSNTMLFPNDAVRQTAESIKRNSVPPYLQNQYASRAIARWRLVSSSESQDERRPPIIINWETILDQDQKAFYHCPDPWLDEFSIQACIPTK